MFNVLLAGVGGQGSVLAAKVLAQAAQNKGWQVRTAETIGMAQRGGSVVSHVRMGNCGEEVYAPLLAQHTADVVIAFEPGEALRYLSYLRPGTIVISARSVIAPITASLPAKKQDDIAQAAVQRKDLVSTYSEEQVIKTLKKALEQRKCKLYVMDDRAILKEVGSARVLNIALLATAVAQECLPISRIELEEAVTACVKPAFVELNKQAIRITIDEQSSISLVVPGIER